jgi:hypothetical protein
MLNNTKEFWNESWIKHIEIYLNSTPRAGIFIKEYFCNISSILEIAGGSCRDSRYLANSGFDVTGSDFDEKTLKYLQEERFPHDELKYSKEDAFSLTFRTSSFELIFHNGFFILFDDNNQLNEMLKEQARVSKRYIIFFVHNSENKGLIKRFKIKSEEDELYKIRFFDKNEIVSIVKESHIDYKSIRVMKFGGFFDTFYKKKFKKIVPNILYPFRKKIIPKLYQFQRWKNTERVCCIIELDK